MVKKMTRIHYDLVAYSLCRFLWFDDKYSPNIDLGITLSGADKTKVSHIIDVLSIFANKRPDYT